MEHKRNINIYFILFSYNYDVNKKLFNFFVFGQEWWSKVDSSISSFIVYTPLLLLACTTSHFFLVVEKKSRTGTAPSHHTMLQTPTESLLLVELIFSLQWQQKVNFFWTLISILWISWLSSCKMLQFYWMSWLSSCNMSFLWRFFQTVPQVLCQAS